MLKALAFCGLCCLSLSVTGQLLVTVSGSCIYPDGTPVGGVDIFISTIFDDSTFYFATAVTDAEGEYLESVPIPAGQIEGDISVSSIGCNGVFDYTTLFWDLNNTQLVHDFTWCEVITVSDSCFVLIIPSVEPLTGLTTLFALSSAIEPVEYLWSDASTAQSITPQDTGTYCVTITGGDGCTSSGCYQFLVDGAGCFVSISSGNGGMVDSALVAIGYGSAPFLYEWSTGDAGQILVVPAEGTYCVTLTDAQGCHASSCMYYFQVTGTLDHASGVMKLFPQPTSDRCHIEIPSLLNGKSQLTITNMNGNEIVEYGNLFIASNEDWLDLGDLSPGMYIVKLQSDQGTWLSKLIKQ